MRASSLFDGYAARLREFIRQHSSDDVAGQSLASESVDTRFNQLATELFALQYEQIPAYRQFCHNRGISSAKLAHWSEIPPMPVAAFKELELTGLSSTERITVFCSSGTTQQQPSRHFHNVESLALYEASLLPWFQAHLLADGAGPTQNARAEPAVLILAPKPPEGGTPNPAKRHPTPFGVPRLRGLGNSEMAMNETGPPEGGTPNPAKRHPTPFGVPRLRGLGNSEMAMNETGPPEGGTPNPAKRHPTPFGVPRLRGLGNSEMAMNETGPPEGGTPNPAKRHPTPFGVPRLRGLGNSEMAMNETGPPEGGTPNPAKRHPTPFGVPRLRGLGNSEMAMNETGPPEGGTPNPAKRQPTPFGVPASAGSCDDHDQNENCCAEPRNKFRFICLTPSPDQAPRSSLAHMFETVRLHFGPSEAVFAGDATQEGDWTLNPEAVLGALDSARFANQPAVLLGTAFSFVHLLDHMERKGIRCSLPQGSRVLETGGYKGRSREIPKWELHALLSDRFGIPPANIIGEYGMCELSSQAYDGKVGDGNSERVFRFPPWARVRLISPETGQEVSEGDTGLIQVFDLANMRSVMAIQTEDLGIRRGAGFELVGRAVQAEPRGCSLMAV